MGQVRHHLPIASMANAAGHTSSNFAVCYKEK